MATIPKEYLDLSNDFGFTSVTEEEALAPHVETVAATADEKLKSKLLEVEQIIMPLLVNLMKDADKKDYIKWPNRGPVIQKQIDRLLAITRS